MLSEPMPCPKIKSGSRWDAEMFMDVDEVACPARAPHPNPKP